MIQIRRFLTTFYRGFPGIPRQKSRFILRFETSKTLVGCLTSLFEEAKVVKVITSHDSQRLGRAQIGCIVKEVLIFSGALVV